jgi:glutamate-ammonia-ligase adenylyltransferase
MRPLRERVQADIAAILATMTTPKSVQGSAPDAQALIEQEKPPRDVWDLKLTPGGLIDLEFIAQVAVLTGQVDAKPAPTGTRRRAARMKPEFADSQTVNDLVEAHRLYSLTQIVRLCLDRSRSTAKDAPPGLTDLWRAATDLPDFKVLEAHLKDTARSVRKQASTRC